MEMIVWGKTRGPIRALVLNRINKEALMSLRKHGKLTHIIFPYDEQIGEILLRHININSIGSSSADQFALSSICSRGIICSSVSSCIEQRS